jgi:23S rRNA pseudouridine1911/1915/1917 synthase
VAIVWNRPDPESGRIETELARDPRDRKRMAVVGEGRGKRAVTNYQMLESYQYTSLVEFRLETGRTHQIRVHARHIGCPVLADRTYGGDRIIKGPDTARRRAYYRNLFADLPRQALHARTLGFRHPITNEQMDFECPIPGDMMSAIERLRAGDPNAIG